MENNIDRRSFLKNLAIVGVAFTLKMKGGMEVFAQTASGAADLVAVMGGEPEAMFKRAIEEMGGIGKFVKRGQKIVVKPNIG
ncbi:MAG: twin-arginine translocation signal domain-containing protein, partial [Fibromonadales bacterium]|nr:twin-arginine translocation signal domain-containing protein [Fibromonadales bacterium]